MKTRIKSFNNTDKIGLTPCFYQRLYAQNFVHKFNYDFYFKINNVNSRGKGFSWMPVAYQGGMQ